MLHLFLKQDHHLYDEETVINTVIMGNTKLYDIMKEKEELYSHTEFTEADGMRLAYLEGEFMDMDGWNAESDAAVLLNNLGIDVAKHYLQMNELTNISVEEIINTHSCLTITNNAITNPTSNNNNIVFHSIFR